MALKRVRVRVGERWYTVDVDDLSVSPVSVTVEGETFLVEVESLPSASSTHIQATPTPSRARRRSPRAAVTSTSEKLIRSPMPGRVLSIMVKPGDKIPEGEEMCVVEAMKMEQSIRAPRDGVVKKVHVKPQQQVNVNDPLVELE